jgi:hypothetical protein
MFSNYIKNHLVNRFATALKEAGGPPERLSKKDSLFESIVTCKDGAPDGFEEAGISIE